jgi:hypothetical protein
MLQDRRLQGCDTNRRLHDICHLQLAALIGLAETAASTGIRRRKQAIKVTTSNL